VVTDHHLPPEVLPRAVAVVDPHRLDCAYPDPDLTGAGLAYKLAAALLARHGASTDGLAALAAIGTVADLAPMTGESRAIVRLGLEELGRSEHPGLRALLSRAAERPERPTWRDLAFGIAPRVNAAGRIADCELAIGLLLEDRDLDRAEALAEELEAVHLRRRELTAVAVADAQERAALSIGDGPLLLRDDGWAAGLVGLIAGRLSDALARPVAIATLVGDEVRGSVRAPADFHVAAALEACASLLTKAGGHAAAGGFSLAPVDWDRFVSTFAALARPYPADPARRPERPGRVVIDLVLPSRYLDWTLAEQLERLAPFGPGHVEPVLAITGMVVRETRRAGPDETHLLLKMRRGLETVDAIGFGLGASVPLPEPATGVDLVGTLERDTFQGMPRLRIRIVDYADATLSPLAVRRRMVAAIPLPAAG
jgi:single-stranded-DNA-specific exonuclease